MISEPMEQAIADYLRTVHLPAHIEGEGDCIDLEVIPDEVEATAMAKRIGEICSPFIDRFMESAERAGMTKAQHRDDPGWWHRDLNVREANMTPEEKDKEGQ